MKKFFVVIVSALSLFALFTMYYYPEHLAQPKFVSEFFNMPSGTNSSFIVLDKMYSQGGSGVFGMGTDNYWLRIVESPQSLGQTILNAGGIQTDSIYSITVIRGNIEGTLIVHKYDDKGHLRFYKSDN